MKSHNAFVKSAQSIIIVTILVNILYWYQDLFLPNIPFQEFLDLVDRLRIMVVFLSFLALLAMFILIFLSRQQVTFISIFMAITLASCFIVAFIIIGMRDHLNMAKLGEQRYHLVLDNQFGDSITNYQIFECNDLDLGCDVVSNFVSSNNYSTKMITDPEAGEINIVLEVVRNSYRLVFTYGLHGSRKYVSCEKDLRSYYCLAEKINEDGNVEYPPTYMLYVCTTDYGVCRRMPFEYENTDPGIVSLVFDEGLQVLQVIARYEDNEQLIFSLNDEPTCHVDDCVLVDK